jgi:hypothetical protein
VLDSLKPQDALETRASLASLMGLLKKSEGAWRDAQGQIIQLDSWLQTGTPTIVDPYVELGLTPPR